MFVDQNFFLGFGEGGVLRSAEELFGDLNGAHGMIPCRSRASAPLCRTLRICGNWRHSNQQYIRSRLLILKYVSKLRRLRKWHCHMPFTRKADASNDAA